MDPNANLKEIRAILTRNCDNGIPIDPDDAERLVELIEALDMWCSKGGFLPDAWVKCGRQIPR